MFPAFFVYLLFSGTVLLVPTRAITLDFSKHAKRTERGVHFPIYKRVAPRLPKRESASTAIGLGDVEDVTYNVLVRVGSTETPLVLDTGSSDLWVISDDCKDNCTSGVPLYPQATFQSTGLSVNLQYGDSRTGTHAFGPIGADSAGLAGLILNDQYFSAIIDTNTTILETGSAGIFGLGFPAISVLWRELLQAQLSGAPPQKRSDELLSSPQIHRRVFDFNFNRPVFPSFEFISPSNSTHTLPSKRQASPFISSAEAISSFATYGPLLIRMISQGMLTMPMIATTLQRDTVDIGGNVGMLSIGELPSGIEHDSLTWVPLRAYGTQDGGLPPPPDAPNETYPLAWEIPLDDVYFDGTKLPRSTLSSPTISLSALVDTGSSLIRGPRDVIEYITQSLGGSHFDCATPHNLTFVVGGKPFSVDPRDFIHQSFTDEVRDCEAALTYTDPPGSGFLYSWSLGDPFLKSALVAFYYGNLTHPSQDPPRMGLLSTLPPDADAALQHAVSVAAANGGNFPETSELAPSGTYSASATGVGGVPQATELGAPNKTTDTKSTGAARSPTTTWSSPIIALVSLGIGILILLGP